jgi:hypothetical protein
MSLDAAFSSFPLLSTDRFRLRRIEPGDAEAFFQIKSDPEVTHSYGREAHRSTQDTQAWIQRIEDTYTQHDGIMWAITFKTRDFPIGSCIGDPAIKLLEEKNLQGKITLVTADLSEQILGGIERGTVAFTSDCQQYLWGYLPVVYLHLYHKYGMRPVSPTFTGPSIIDKSNLEAVKALVSEGIR